MATPFIGEMVGFGGNFAPRNWATCQGQILRSRRTRRCSRSSERPYGGNGQTTFGLPDLQGRSAIGFGQLQGGQQYTLGQVGGTENTTLTTSNLPSHTHAGTLNATTAKATSQVAAAGSLLAKSVDTAGTATPEIYVPTGTAGTQVALGGLTIGNTGNNIPFSIRGPYLTITWLIAIQGIFPSRN